MVFLRLVTRVPATVLAIFFLTAVMAPALTVEDGNVRLVIDDATGAFSALFRHSTTGSFVAFLGDPDPTSTAFVLIENNQVHRMGSTTAFSTSVEAFAGGARVIWRSRNTEIVQRFSFVAAAGSSVSSGVMISIAITNLTDSPLGVTPVYLVDSFLGEASNVHFRTASLERVTREVEFVPSVRDPAWVSPSAENPDNSLQWGLVADGLTPPQRVVFANRRRLEDNLANYAVNGSRNFNLLPFSINDSAALMYWSPTTLAVGGTFALATVFGAETAAGFNVAGETNPGQSAESTPAIAGATDQETALELVNRIVEQLFNRVGTGAIVPESELSEYRATLESLERQNAER